MYKILAASIQCEIIYKHSSRGCGLEKAAVIKLSADCMMNGTSTLANSVLQAQVNICELYSNLQPVSCVLVTTFLCSLIKTLLAP